MLFMPDSPRRFQGHSIGHHPNANTERNPNILRLCAISLLPGISRARRLR